MSDLAVLTRLDRLGIAQKAGTVSATSSTTTLVDTANLTEANDYWNGMEIIFQSGVNIGLSRRITDYVLSTGTLTFGRALLAAPAVGDYYCIVPRTSESAGIDKLLEYMQSEPKVSPDTAAGVTATAAGGGGFARGAYVEIVAATGIPTNYKPVGITITNQSAFDEYQIDLATGAAASETDVGTFMRGSDQAYIPIPSIAEIPAGTRLAARIGCNDAVARTLQITIHYIDTLA